MKSRSKASISLLGPTSSSLPSYVLPKSSELWRTTSRGHSLEERTVGASYRLRFVDLEAFALVQHRLPQGSDGRAPLLHGMSAVSVGSTLDLHRPVLLVDFALELPIDDEEPNNILNLGRGDLELLGNESQREPCVRGNELENTFGAHVASDFVDILRDKRIGEHVFVALQHRFITVYVVALVSIDQIRHRGDPRVVLVGFGFLRIEGVNVGLHEHGSQNQVFQHLDPLQ